MISPTWKEIFEIVAILCNYMKSGTWSTFGYSSQIFFTQVGQRSNFSQTGIVLTHWQTLSLHSCSSTTSLLIVIKVSGIFEHTLNLILGCSEDNSGGWISITIEVLGLNVNFIRWVRTKVFQNVWRLSSNFCVFNASSGSWLNSCISYSIAINGIVIFCNNKCFTAQFWWINVQSLKMLLTIRCIPMQDANISSNIWKLEILWNAG